MSISCTRHSYSVNRKMCRTTKGIVPISLLAKLEGQVRMVIVYIRHSKGLVASYICSTTILVGTNVHDDI